MEKLNHSRHPRYLTLLSMLCITFWIMCLVGQDRIILLDKGYVAAAVFPYPIVCCILDIIAEIYGYKEARKTLWLAFFSLYLFTFSMTFLSKLPVPLFWSIYDQNFNATMSPLLRIMIVASVSIIIGQYINIYIISKLRTLVKGKYFGLRSIGSTIVGDTVTFALSLYGYFVGSMTGHEIFVTIIDELIIMYVAAIILAFPATLVVFFLRRREPHYVAQTTFNPFAKS